MGNFNAMMLLFFSSCYDICAINILSFYFLVPQRRGSDGSQVPLAPLACQEADQLDGVQEGSEEEDSEEEEEVRISPRSDSPRGERWTPEKSGKKTLILTLTLNTEQIAALAAFFQPCSLRIPSVLAIIPGASLRDTSLFRKM